MNRVKRLVINPETLVSAMQAGAWKIVGGALPDDATVTRVGVNSQTGNIEIVIGSLQFETVLIGGVIPETTPVQFESVRA